MPPATMKIKNNFFPGEKTEISECHFKVLKDAGATVTIDFLFIRKTVQLAEN